MKVKVLVATSCSTPCDAMDCSLPGSSVHGILQARRMEWVPFSSPGDLPDPGIEPESPALQAESLPSEPPGKFYRIVHKEKWKDLNKTRKKFLESRKMRGILVFVGCGKWYRATLGRNGLTVEVQALKGPYKLGWQICQDWKIWGVPQYHGVKWGLCVLCFMSVGWFLRLMELIYVASPSEEVLEIILNRFNISSFITFCSLEFMDWDSCPLPIIFICCQI